MAEISLKLLNTGHGHTRARTASDNESIGGKSINDNKRISSSVPVFVMSDVCVLCANVRWFINGKQFPFPSFSISYLFINGHKYRIVCNLFSSFESFPIFFSLALVHLFSFRYNIFTAPMYFLLVLPDIRLVSAMNDNKHEDDYNIVNTVLSIYLAV